MSANNLLKNAPFIRFQDPSNFVEIKSFQNELEKHRVEQHEKVMKLATDIRSSLEKLKSEVLNSLTKTLNIDLLRKKLLEVGKKIMDLKLHIREVLVKILQDEFTLINDLNMCEKKIDEWETPIDFKIFKASKPSIYKVQNNGSNNPVTEFQNFLLNYGGHNGGWLEQDHLLYLKQRKKIREKERFLSAVHNLLPDFSYDEIVEHNNWYEQYECLRNLQKEAIQKWKAGKGTKQEKDVENKEVNPKRKIKKKSATILHQIKIAERIKEWKKLQITKKLEEEEKIKEEKKQLQLERKKMNEINKKKKLAVSQFKADKLNKIQGDLISEKPKNITDIEKTKRQMLLKSFRLQDEKFIEKKKIIQLQVESKSKGKFKKLMISKPPIDFLLQRDPERIFRPTTIWTQHCLTDEKPEKLHVFNLNNIPHLMIPEWRRELN